MLELIEKQIRERVRARAYNTFHNSLVKGLDALDLGFDFWIEGRAERNGVDSLSEADKKQLAMNVRINKLKEELRAIGPEIIDIYVEREISREAGKIVKKLMETLDETEERA